MAFVEGLSTFLLDFGVQVTAGSSSALAIFDAPDEEILSGKAQSTQYSIVYVAGSLGSIGYLSSVTVSGTPGGQFDGSYRLRANPVGIEDGRFQKALLEAVS